MPLMINGEIVRPDQIFPREVGLPAHSETKTCPSMPRIKITYCDLQSLIQLTVKRRLDCVASFSVNEKREIWMYATRGWTKEKQREYVSSHPVVERIAEVYLEERPEGGRILLKSNGLFYRPLGKGFDVKFADVEFEERT